ncbi:MAG: FHA domain-containing protein [Candidatus Sulfotelmatobacter sp.]|jgi:hypothetical protein
MVRLSKALYLSSPIVSIVASIVFGVGVFFVMKGDLSGGLPFVILGSLAALYAGILGLVFYYKMWESIQDGYARMSPAKAVGFLFIPFFNVYWIFQVFWGFSKDYNAYVDRHAINTKKLSEGLFLAFSILPLSAAVPFLNFVTIPVYWVMVVIMVSQVCDAVNALPPHGGEGAAGFVTGPVPIAAGATPLRRDLPPHSLSLYCLSGEFANEALMVPADGVSIGRDPARVNLVLSATEISGAHARVMPEAQSAQVWLEDLHSLNGTFYSQSGKAEWVKLQGKVLLSPGARFRLAVDGPEFEIRG